MIVVLALAIITAIVLTHLRASGKKPDRVRQLGGVVDSYVSVFLLSGLIYSVTLQIVLRIVPNSGITAPWTTEAARLFLVWLVLWGAARVQMDDDHIRLSIVTDRLAQGAQRVLKVFQHLLIVSLLILIVWKAATDVPLSLDLQTVSLGWPSTVFSSSVLVGGSIMLISTSYRLITEIRGLAQS